MHKSRAQPDAPSFGRVSVMAAWGFCWRKPHRTGRLLQFNVTTIFIGLVARAGCDLSLHEAHHLLAAIVFGACFQLGALVGYTSLPDSFTCPRPLYAAGIFWTLGYDTIYAHQDREDDALVGVKSSALKLGENTRSRFCFSTPHRWPVLRWPALGGVGRCFGPAGNCGLAIGHASYRLDIDDPARCLQIFKSNRDAGFVIAGAFILGIFKRQRLWKRLATHKPR